MVGRRNFAHLFFSFQVHIKHGTSFKWKSRCKVEREGQKWTDNEVSVKNNADLLYAKMERQQLDSCMEFLPFCSDSFIHTVIFLYLKRAT